ncbi:MAG: N-acetyltransferase, partial [Sedimenticolaceae bacterium]
MKAWIRRSVIERFRKLGALNGSLLLADRLLGGLSGNQARIIRYYLAAQPVPSVSSDALRPTASSPVRRIHKEDPIVADFPRPAAVIAGRFAAGARCYVAEVRGRFAGYLWLAFGGYDEDEVRCRYEFAEPGICSWDDDVYVEPAFRLGRTFARLWSVANRDLAMEGFRWS